MKSFGNWAARGGVWAALLAVSGTVARAEVVTYNIVQNQSQISLTASGTAFGGQLTVTEQQASAITRYNTTIVADVTNGGPNFIGGGQAKAVNPTGAFNIPLTYQPNINGAAGSAPANYGVTLSAPVAFDIPAFTIPPEIIAQFPFLPSTLDLGVLSSIVTRVALRDVALDINSAGQIPEVGTVFDANQTSIDVVGGFADINIAARLTQPNILQKAAIQLLLGSLQSSLPQLGITVSSPSFFSLDIDLGFGFRTDLSLLPSVPNTALADGTITGLDGPPGPSTLILPVAFSLDDTLTSALGPLASVLDLNLTFDFAGSLRATATVPEASSFVMMGVAASAAGLVVARRRRQNS
jgi:hypothetical protein